MKRLTRSSVSMAIVAGVMTASSLALAAVGDTDTDDDGDTNLVVGYDATDGVLVYGVSSTDGDLDCSLPEETDLTVVYGDESTEGPVATRTVDDVTADGESVSFSPTGEGDSVPYGEASDCALTGASITGPQGQINHGTIVSAMARLLDGNKGCLMRHFAGSELGKDDQQVRVSDLGDDEPAIEETTDPILTFMNLLATCEKGRSGEAKDNPGQLKKAEREAARAAGAAPGRSGDAPGKNKDR